MRNVRTDQVATEGRRQKEIRVSQRKRLSADWLDKPRSEIRDMWKCQSETRPHMGWKGKHKCAQDEGIGRQERLRTQAWVGDGERVEKKEEKSCVVTLPPIYAF